MKKLLFSLSMLLVFGVANAQDSPSKMLKSAKKSLDDYNISTSADKAEKLYKAKELIDNVMTSIGDLDEGSLAKAWKYKGKIYNELAAKDIAEKTVNPGYQQKDSYGLPAFEAFQKTLELSTKKYEKKEALKDMLETITHLQNTGASMYDAQNYKGAYENFKGVLDVHEVLTANGSKSTLQDETQKTDLMFAAGLSALNANLLDEANPIFQQLYDASYDKPAVYEALYKINADKDAAKAEEILNTGRTKFPDDVSLLFTEINHYLKANKLDELVGKLKSAIEKEPENKSLYSTLGNVYDNLFQREQEAGNAEKSDEYFNDAKSYYEKALQIDDKYGDAVYSIGALYYNKAASTTKEMKSLEDDYSPAGTRKFEAKKAEMMGYFDQALPHFQRAETLNPNDRNTLIALKEIYARKDDLEKTQEFKTRLENITNEIENTSYFGKQ